MAQNRPIHELNAQVEIREEQQIRDTLGHCSQTFVAGRQVLLGALARIDVHRGTDDAQRPPRGVALDDAAAVEHPAPAAIRAQHAVLELQAIAVAFQVLLERRLDMTLIVRMHALRPGKRFGVPLLR